jgi:hypothetical protein
VEQHEVGRGHSLGSPPPHPSPEQDDASSGKAVAAAWASVAGVGRVASWIAHICANTIMASVIAPLVHVRRARRMPVLSIRNTAADGNVRQRAW